MRRSLASLTLATMLAAAPLFTGCGKDEQSKPPQGPQGRLQLEELARKGTAYLDTLLNSANPSTRMAALQALGFVRDDPEATKLLIKLIEGDSEDETAVALMAIGAQGPPEAKALLQKYIKDPRARVRGGVCVGIAEYGDTTLYPLLDEVAADDADPYIRRVASVNRQQLETGRYVPFAHKKR